MFNRFFSIKKMQLILLCLSFIIINNSLPSALGLKQDEFDVDIYSMTYELTKGYIPPYQGGSRELYLKVISTCNNELQITWVGIHFEWMDEGRYYRKDLADAPLYLPSGGGSEMLDSITYSVPSDAKVGDNEYHFKVYAKEKGLLGWSDKEWTSPTYLLTVRDKNEKIFNELVQEIYSDLTTFERTQYQSSDGKEYIQKATVSYNTAVELGDSKLWSNAISKLNEASNDIKNADIAERAYREAQKSSSSSSSSSGSTSGESSEKNGIPGFPYIAIMLGLVMVLLIRNRIHY